MDGAGGEVGAESLADVRGGEHLDVLACGVEALVPLVGQERLCHFTAAAHREGKRRDGFPVDDLIGLEQVDEVDEASGWDGPTGGHAPGRGGRVQFARSVIAALKVRLRMAETVRLRVPSVKWSRPDRGGPTLRA